MRKKARWHFERSALLNGKGNQRVEQDAVLNKDDFDLALANATDEAGVNIW